MNLLGKAIKDHNVWIMEQTQADSITYNNTKYTMTYETMEYLWVSPATSTSPEIRWVEKHKETASEYGVFGKSADNTMWKGRAIWDGQNEPLIDMIEKY